MSEMVDRVARQMYEYDFWGERAPKWPSMNETHRAPFYKRARAALAVLREPTEAMAEVGGVVGMMMADLVARAARASYEKRLAQIEAGYPQLQSGPLPCWDDLAEGSRALLVEQQRAAIAAMREPTEAMIRRACVEVFSDDGWELSERLFENGWRAMIDAALAGKS